LGTLSEEKTSEEKNPVKTLIINVFERMYFLIWVLTFTIESLKLSGR
jgi:hypothetical protein